MKYIGMGMIRVYQMTLSKVLPPSCVLSQAAPITPMMQLINMG